MHCLNNYLPGNPDFASLILHLLPMSASSLTRSHLFPWHPNSVYKAVLLRIPITGCLSSQLCTTSLNNQSTNSHTVFKFGRFIHRVHLNKSPLKSLEKREHGYIQVLLNFFEYPYYLRNGQSYLSQILYAHS